MPPRDWEFGNFVNQALLLIWEPKDILLPLKDHGIHEVFDHLERWFSDLNAGRYDELVQSIFPDGKGGRMIWAEHRVVDNMVEGNIYRLPSTWKIGDPLLFKFKESYVFFWHL